MTHFLRNRTVWAFALTVGIATVGASAQQPAPPVAAPAAPQAPTPPAGPAPAPAPQAPLAGGQQPAPIDRYVVGQAMPVAAPGTQMMSLTLEQAIELALDKNLDLKAARLNPAGVDYQLLAARAAFSPQFTGTYGYNNAASPNNNPLETAGSRINQLRQTYNMSFSQSSRWYGGRLTASFNNSRTSTNANLTITNPNYASNMSFNYTQPLLAGLKIDNQRNQLRTLSIQRQVADIQLASTIENTRANVRNAYWNLRQAIEQIEIQKRSLDLANRLFQDNKTKVEIGTLAQIETLTSETQVANAEQALLNAEIQWTNSQETLKRLLAEGPQDPVYTATINPIEPPRLTVVSVDIAAALREALANRTDLVQSRRNLDISRLNLEITQNVTKPQLDLQGGYNASGQGGRRLINGVIQPGGYSDALGQITGFDLPTWNLQFNFTYPLFMRAAKANYARAELQLNQSEAQLKAQELSVAVTVGNAGRAVENSYKQYQAAQKAREVAEKNAEAEQTRFEVGMSTNYNVVQAQNNLTTQRLTELRAIISYLNAVAEFDRVQKVGN